MQKKLNQTNKWYLPSHVFLTKAIRQMFDKVKLTVYKSENI